MVTDDNLQKIVMKMVEKTVRREEQSKKRFYSDYIEDKLLDCYTISKQYAEKDAMMILVGNKSDLLDSRRVPEEEVSIFCKEKKIPYVECSAK